MRKKDVLDSFTETRASYCNRSFCRGIFIESFEPAAPSILATNFSHIISLKSKGAYHLAKKSGNFGLKSNGKVIFRKFRSETVEYLQRYSSFPIGMEGGGGGGNPYHLNESSVSRPFPRGLQTKRLIDKW